LVLVIYSSFFTSSIASVNMASNNFPSTYQGGRIY
jgi:hypothetical protein